MGNQNVIHFQEKCFLVFTGKATEALFLLNRISRGGQEAYELES